MASSKWRVVRLVVAGVLISALIGLAKNYAYGIYPLYTQRIDKIAAWVLMVVLGIFVIGPILVHFENKKRSRKDRDRSR